MGTIKTSKNIWKHVICCMVLLIIFVLTIGMHVNTESQDNTIAENTSDTVPLQDKIIKLFAGISYDDKREQIAGPKDNVTVEIVDDLDKFIIKHAETLKFFSNVFGVKYNDIIIDLYSRNKDKEFEITNVGHLLNKKGTVKTFKNEEYGIVEYFYNYVRKNPKKVNKKRVPYSGGSKYVENLIIYYTTHIYENVDTATALSIGAAESGYYKVKYMLKSNNVFGGMSSKGLIKYQNIEYGVLSYVRMLSKQYYDKGLNTVSKIGYKYCPSHDSNGNKIASPHWISLVNNANKKYKKYNYDVKVEQLSKLRSA